MFRLEVVSECGSTNDELFARRGEPGFAGTALLALRQTSGHGRRGREWWSGEGNLALSVGFRFRGGDVLSRSRADGAGPLSSSLSEEVALLPFRAGIALAETLREFLPAEVDVRLKWPNDVYVNGRKISGLLSQARQAGDEVDLVLGMGVNLRVAPPWTEVCAVSDWVSPPSPEEFAKVLLARLEKAPEEFSALEAAWEKHARVRGAGLTVMGEAAEFQGVGLLPTGELEVKDSAGNSRKLSSETVSLRFA